MTKEISKIYRFAVILSIIIFFAVPAQSGDTIRHYSFGNIPEYEYPFGEERLIFSQDQIKDKSELTVGKKYIVYRLNYDGVRHAIIGFSSRVVKIIGEPFNNGVGIWFVKVEVSAGARRRGVLGEVLILNKLGVEPYDNGMWYRHGWMVPYEKK